MSRTTAMLGSLLVAVVALSTPFAAGRNEGAGHRAEPASPPHVIWADSGSVASLDLFHGAGGKGHAPDPKGRFTFVREDLQASSPKFDIEDEHGVQWKVKLGEEPASETAATRFLWAAGYIVDEDYYVARLRVRKVPTLHRGAQFVSADGTVRHARLERKIAGVKRVGTWDWFDNPFVGTRALNGLRVMMALVNSWDLAETNNAVYEVNGERRYLVSDLGATFGKSGNNLVRSKSVPRDYAASTFIETPASEFVDFVLHSRPFFLSVVNVVNYRDRTRMEQVARHIPRADAKWIGRRLGMLSERQIRDAFRAAGYTHGDVGIYTRAMRRRIAALNAL